MDGAGPRVQRETVDNCETLEALNDLRNATICQRWGSGSLDQSGMPRRTTPLVRIQNSFLQQTCPLFVPPAFIPWNSAQCCSKFEMFERPWRIHLDPASLVELTFSAVPLTTFSALRINAIPFAGHF